VGKRLSRDGKRDDSETPTSVVLCNLRIVPEYFCPSGDAHPSVITVDVLMCLMFEKRTAHAIVQRSWWEHSPSLSRRRRPTRRRRHGTRTGPVQARTRMVACLGQPQRRKTFCPGLICAASRFLYRYFGGTGRGEGALTRRTWRKCCRRGTGFQESRSGNRAGVAVVRICRGALCNKVFQHEGEKVQWRN
jgi:hypothetical protein